MYVGYIKDAHENWSLFLKDRNKSIPTILGQLSVFVLCVCKDWVQSVCCCRSSPALSSHSCAHKYLLKTHSPGPFISLYLLLVQPSTCKAALSATLGPFGLYPAAVQEYDWAAHPSPVRFSSSDGEEGVVKTKWQLRQLEFQSVSDGRKLR